MAPALKRPRLLPHRDFPDYAYLPGRQPHPVRDPAGHSYHVGPLPLAEIAPSDSDSFAWGQDLFNHSYYWEAHEAWEGVGSGWGRNDTLSACGLGPEIFACQ
nr:DUF309 domain-containing protein [Rhizobium jaguaris]